MHANCQLDNSIINGDIGNNIRVIPCKNIYTEEPENPQSYQPACSNNHNRHSTTVLLLVWWFHYQYTIDWCLIGMSSLNILLVGDWLSLWCSMAKRKKLLFKVWARYYKNIRWIIVRRKNCLHWRLNLHSYQLKYFHFLTAFEYLTDCTDVSTTTAR